MVCCLLIVRGHLREAGEQASGLCTLIRPQPHCSPQRDNMDVSVRASRSQVQQTRRLGQFLNVQAGLTQ